MDASLQEVSLASIGGGAAVELFDYELAKVLKNIADPNTGAEVVREVKLTVKIKPGADRSYATIEIACVSKPAPAKPYAAQVLLDSDGTDVKAWENRAKQQELPGIDKVTKFTKGGGA